MKRIVIINPPHTAIGSRMPNEHLPPLGLFSIAGPLIDAAFDVHFIDAEFKPMTPYDICKEVSDINPHIVMMGHSGSTAAQPTINILSVEIKKMYPHAIIIIGGVFPTYHWKQILEENPAIDYVIRGEGEAVVLELVTCIHSQGSIHEIKGISYRREGQIVKNPDAPLLKDLDTFRIAWEWLKKYDYTYWGKKKAVVIQFSRGCPYPCTYCGQSIFWKKWRHRNPQKLADEIEILHHTYGVEVINFADENPSSNPRPWIEFLTCLEKKNLKLILVGSIRADNIVRDKAHLPLYKKVGFERFLLGIENYDAVTLQQIKKAGSITKDMEAIRLLRQHGILSMATYVVGFGEETTRDFYNSLKQLLTYDPDQIQLLYVTPHRWTPYFEDVKHKNIILNDQRHWDYKHQVLEIKKLYPLQVIFYVKLIEIIMQARPKAIYRLLFQKEYRLRDAMMWYTKIGRRVWFYEWVQFLFFVKRLKQPLALDTMWKWE